MEPYMKIINPLIQGASLAHLQAGQFMPMTVKLIPYSKSC